MLRRRSLGLGTAVAAALVFGCAGTAATSVLLVGNQAVEASADSDSAGAAEAFQATAAASGTAGDVMVYVDTTPPTTVRAGLYADAAGHPGALLAQGTLAAPKGAAWNDIPLTTSPSLSAGAKYWIAILSPAGAGTVHIRDRKSSGLSETSSVTGLSALPAAWSTGTRYTDAFLSAYVLAGTADTSPPAQPQGFAATAATATAISTSWSASTDNVGVTAYSLYVGAQQVGTSASPAYTFGGLACGQSYTLGVAASDAAGNLSARSTLNASTLACTDTTPPSAPSGLTVTSSTPSTISLLWSASTDNVGVAGYDVSLDGRLVTTVSGTSYAFGGLTCSTFHTLAVDAYDAAGNTSSVSSLAASSGSCPDTTPPTVAFTSPAAGSSIAGTVTVAANASDTGGVSSVRFTLDGATLGAVDTTAPYQVTWDTTMFADGTHTLAAVATDAAGNSATASESVTVANATPTAITVKKIYEGADSDRITHTFAITSAVPVGHTLLLTHASTVDATDGSGGIVVPGGVSDPGGNAWRQVAVSHPGLSFTTVEAWTAPVTTALAAGASITVKGYSRGLSDEIAIFDVTGLAADPGDLQASYAGYNNSPATPYMTPTQAHVLLVAVHGQSSVGAPWWTPEASTPAWTKYVDRFDSSNSRGIAVDMREVTARVAYRTAGTISSTATSNNLIVALRAGR